MRKHHISLGENCLVAHVLSKYNLKEESYPFGWVRSNICYNLEIIKDNFEHFLSKKYLYSTWSEEDRITVFKNSYYKKSLDIFNETVSNDFEFTHHKVIDEKKSIDSYKRKVKRFQELLKSKDEIVFYYHYRHGPKNNLKKLLGVFEELSGFIKNEYNKTNITYVIFYQNMNTKKKHFNINSKGKFVLVECFDNNEWRGARNYDGKSFQDQFDIIFKELDNMYGLKEDLVVTLADEKYLDQAKQLFSSVYWNAGWKGDFMLMAHNIPEKKLKWFRDKGILVRKYDSRYLGNVGKLQCPAIRLDKFNIFIREMKRWNKIIFLDSDIIVRSSLDQLVKKEGFWACSEGLKLRDHFSKRPWKTYRKLKRNYDLRKDSFNSGVMVFDSQIIKMSTFPYLQKIFEEYRLIHKFADQPTLNLFFNKEVRFLPPVYNCIVSNMVNYLDIKPEKIKAIILHFTENKPWDKKNPFYGEWKSNLEKAEEINLGIRPVAKKKWSEDQIEDYSRYLRKRKRIYFHKKISHKLMARLDKGIGLVGIFLRKRSPRLYNILKR